MKQCAVDAANATAARIAELDIELHEDEFQYWRKQESPRKAR